MKKTKLLLITSFLMLVVLLLVPSCSPESYSLDSTMDKSDINFEVTPDLVANPGGNVIKLKNLTSGIIPYWSYTDSKGNELGHSNSNETSISLPFSGTYNISLSAFGQGGSVTSTKTVTVAQNDTSLFSDPRWNLLTNGVKGKTWVLRRADPIEYAGANYLHSPAMNDPYGVDSPGDWNWDPGSLQSWSGYEDKDWGEITFNLNGGFNVIVKQTSFVTGSTAQTTTSGAFNYTMTPHFTGDRLSFTGGAEMLHMNESSSLNFASVHLIELTATTLSYTAVTSGGISIYHLVVKQ